MTLLSMPRVLDPKGGKLICETNGVRHSITCRADPISQRARVDDERSNISLRNGSRVRVEWSVQQNAWDENEWPFNPSTGWWRQRSPDRYRDRFIEMAHGYAFFNPHLTLTLDWFGDRTKFKATDKAWAKWKPNKPTSCHWYTQERFERLIAAYITVARDTGVDRTVADFVGEFDGLSGKRKRILRDTGLARMKLTQLTNGDGLDHDQIAALLAAMKQAAKPVSPRRIGIIGETHFRSRFQELGARHGFVPVYAGVL